MARPKRQAACHPDRQHLANGLCKQCYDQSPKRLEARRVQSKRHKIRIAKYYLKHKYNISIEEYDRKLYEQNKQCAICGRNNTGHKNQKMMLVDHCHKTGRVRGLLCSKCNRGLGQFDDNPELMLLAVEYLRRYQQEVS
jgi:hypothetical protein